MNTFQEIFPVQTESLEKGLQEKYNAVLEKFSPDLQEKYALALKASSNYKKQLSAYAFWYLYNLCYHYNLLELLVRLNGKVKFHFGDCFLSPHTEMESEGVNTLQKKDICFLSHEKKTLVSHLQIDVALSAAAKKLILPIWRIDLVPFAERYFIFSAEESIKRGKGARSVSVKTLDCLSQLEQQLRSKVTAILKEGEVARLLHVKLGDFQNVIQVLGLHESHKLFFDIYEQICSQFDSSASVIAFIHSSYFIVAPAPDLKADRMKLYKALYDVRKDYHIKFTIYEKNLYNEAIDMLSLSEELHF